MRILLTPHRTPRACLGQVKEFKFHRDLNPFACGCIFRLARGLAIRFAPSFPKDLEECNKTGEVAGKLGPNSTMALEAEDSNMACTQENVIPECD